MILFGEKWEKIQKLYWQIPRQEALGYLGKGRRLDSGIIISDMQAAQFFTKLFCQMWEMFGSLEYNQFRLCQYIQA